MRLLLLLGFLAVPILEIYVVFQLGYAIGFGWTILALIAESALGAWIVKREGRRAWAALREAMTTGRLPHSELADAALVLVGGTLLLTPGFVTDVFGFFFVLPFTRPLARAALNWFIARRAARSAAVWFGVPAGVGGAGYEPPGPGGSDGGRRGGSADGRIVPGHVVDDER